MGVFDWKASPKKEAKDGEQEEGQGILAPLWWIFFPLSAGLTAIVWVVFVRHGMGQVPFGGALALFRQILGIGRRKMQGSSV